MAFGSRSLHAPLKERALNGQTLLARSGTILAEVGSPAGFSNFRRDGSPEYSCSLIKFVELMGITSLVLV